MFRDSTVEGSGMTGTDVDQQCELKDLGSVFGTVRGFFNLFIPPLIVLRSC